MLASAICSCCDAKGSCLIANQTCSISTGFIKRVKVAKRQVVYCEGLPAESLLVVKSGSVNLIQNDLYGGSRIARFACTGDILGFEPFLPQKSWAFTAVTREQTELCVIPGVEFERIFRPDSRRLWELFLRLAADILDSQIEKLEISGDRVAQRVHNAIASIGKSASITLKQWELAQFLGVSEETISRQLKAQRLERKYNSAKESCGMTKVA